MNNLFLFGNVDLQDHPSLKPFVFEVTNMPITSASVAMLKTDDRVGIDFISACARLISIRFEGWSVT